MKIRNIIIVLLLSCLASYGVLTWHVNRLPHQAFGDNFCWIEGSPAARGVGGMLLHSGRYYPNPLKDIKIATAPPGEHDIYFGVVGLRQPATFSVNGAEIKFDPEVHAWSYRDFSFWPPTEYYAARRRFQQTYGQAMEGISSLTSAEQDIRYQRQSEAVALFNREYPDDFGGEFLSQYAGVLEDECRKIIASRNGR